MNDSKTESLNKLALYPICLSIGLGVLLPATLFADASDMVLRQMSLDAEGINRLHIDSGPGDLIVTGRPGANEINVATTIDVSPSYSGDDPDTYVDEFVTLSLERRGRTATLHAGMNLGLGISRSPEIDLEVTLPADLEIEIVDEAGAIRISGLDAEVSLSNGPGNIQVVDVSGQLTIDDTAGRILVENVRSDVQISDRSGSITVRDVDGTVFVTDSSGHINAEGISQDLVIEQDTSGDINARDIGGQILRHDQ